MRADLLGAGTDFCTFRADVEEEALDHGIAHCAEGVTVVEYLSDVVEGGLAGLVVDDVDGLWGVDDAVRADDLSLPSDVALGLGFVVGAEETSHLGLLHHGVEGVAECGDGVRVEAMECGVGVESGIGVVDGVDVGEDFVD